MAKAIACVLFCLLAASAWGQSFPSRPITLYVPFVPGPTDTAAR